MEIAFYIFWIIFGLYALFYIQNKYWELMDYFNEKEKKGIEEAIKKFEEERGTNPIIDP